MNKFLIGILFFSLSPFVWGQEQANTQLNCLDNKKVEEVLPYFTQFNALKEKSNGKICLENFEEEVDKQSFQILKSLVAFKKLDIQLSAQSNPLVDEQDEMNVVAIKEASWWKYLTDRADKFIIDPPRCFYSRGTVAFVYGDSKSKVINVCPLFFETGLLEQIETLLHEVRHFDGYAHIPCLDGIYKNRGNSCDESILDGGSYAVTIQALVALTKLETTTKEERYLLEAQAIGRLNNNFNKKVKTKITDYAYLSNREGDVYRAEASNLKKLEFVKKLNTPSLIYSSSRDFTLIPLDRTKNITRLDRRFLVNAPDVGRFASQYNDENVRERELYTQFDYYEDSGFLKDGDYYNSCGISNSRLEKNSIENVKFKSMIKLAIESDKNEAYLMDFSGDVYKVNCREGIVATTEIEKTKRKLPKDLVGGISDGQGKAIILNDSGEILRLNLKNNKILPSEIIQRNWISITPHKIYNFFESF